MRAIHRIRPLTQQEAAVSGPARKVEADIRPVSAQMLASGGRGVAFEYGFADSPFGLCGVLAAGGEIYRFSFVGIDPLECRDSRSCGNPENFAELCREDWPAAGFERRDDMAKCIVGAVFGDEPSCRFVVRAVGSDFRMGVWRALAAVPFGSTVSYAALAAMAGCPRAVRATASAVASNRVGVIIPCHRVVRNDGSTGEFFWGTRLKRALIEWESGWGGR